MNCRQCGRRIDVDQPTNLMEEKSAQRDSMVCEYCGAAHSQSFLFESTIVGLPLDERELGNEGDTTVAAPWGPKSEPEDESKKLIPKRFTGLQTVGRGSFGIVYRCRDQLLKRTVAVKVPCTELFDTKLVMREARAAANLSHPNIVRVYDVVEEAGLAFIISEFIVGQSMRSWLDSRDCNQDERLRILIKIADAISYAHQKGVIHRDIKPGNILIDQQGTPFVIDFGLSRSVNSGEETIGVPGRPIGTPAFMAPEQVVGDASRIDERTDVFSLGVVLYQLLTGQLPFSGTVKEIYQTIRSSAYYPSPKLANAKLDPAIERICIKAMAKEPAERYQTAEEFKTDLQNYLAGNPVSVYPHWHRRRINLLVRRRWLQVTSAGLLATAAGLGWKVWNDAKASNPLTPVSLTVLPDGGKLVWTRFDPITGFLNEEQIQESASAQTIWLTPGLYRVVAQHGDEMIEALRHVPAPSVKTGVYAMRVGNQNLKILHFTSESKPGMVEVQPIRIVPLRELGGSMAYFPSGDVSVERDEKITALFHGQSSRVREFLMDRNETTWNDILKTWPKIELPAGTDPNSPATGLPWNVAATWCELNGRSLPSVWELIWASTNAGTTSFVNGDQRPDFGDSRIEPPQIAAWDQTLGEQPVKGILTGCSEWTGSFYRNLNWDSEGQKFVPGVLSESVADSNTRFPDAVYVVAHNPQQIAQYPIVPANLAFLALTNRFPHLGFRSVRRLKPLPQT